MIGTLLYGFISVMIISLCQPLKCSINIRANHRTILNSIIDSKIDSSTYTVTTNNKDKLHRNKYEQFSKKVQDPLYKTIQNQQQQGLDVKGTKTIISLRGTTVPIKPIRIKKSISKPNTNTTATTSTSTKNVYMSIQPSDPFTFGYTEIGMLTKSHGVKGEIKLQITSDNLSDLKISNNTIVYIKKPNRRTPRPILVTGLRKQVDNKYLISFGHITSRELAEGFRGYLFYIKLEDRPQLKHDEYMIRDLVGMLCYRIHPSDLHHTAPNPNIHTNKTPLTTTTTTTFTPTTSSISTAATTSESPVKLSLKDRLKAKRLLRTQDIHPSQPSNIPLASTTIPNLPSASPSTGISVDINPLRYLDDLPIGIVEGVVPPDELCSPEMARLMHSLLEIRLLTHSEAMDLATSLATYTTSFTTSNTTSTTTSTPLSRKMAALKDYHGDLCLVPLVPSIVRIVDTKLNLLVIDPPTGLLELTYQEKIKANIKGYFAEYAQSVSVELRRELMMSTVLIPQLPPRML